MPPSRLALCLAYALTACLIGTAVAADTTSCPTVAPHTERRPPGADPDQPTRIRADEITGVMDATTRFTGHVEVDRGNLHLNADEAVYDKAEDRVEAEGNVTLTTATGDRYRTSSMEMTLGTQVGETGRGEFALAGRQARGDAAAIRFEGRDHTRLMQARYTTCRAGQDDWFLRMRELELDTDKDIGTAKHTSVEFLGVPVLYLPYLSFPISEQRKSGFLLPGFGHSNQRGTEIAVPYYFNLAPNYDDTLTPRILTRRGLQLQNQFRYLTPGSHGQLEFDYLPNDDMYGDSRAAGTYRHIHTFGPLWSANVDVRAVSDKEYVTDFGDSLSVTSQTHLPQIAELNYRGRLWNVGARLAGYQTVDPAIPPSARPYARLPQLLVASKAPAISGTPNFQLDGEWVQFERDASVTGNRLNAYPSIGLPFIRSYGFLSPRIGVRHIGYNLSGTADSSPSVTAGVFSLDSGLFFDRDTQWGGRAFTQTLEPRFYYLYVPHKDQDALPNFDTSVPDFSFLNLFRDNRFVGGDRIGDANQLTAAVTTRLIDERDGVERASLNLGQIFYFDDRTVNLPAGTANADTSDIVAEATAWLVGNWYARGGLQWNRDARQTRKGSFYLQHHPARDRIVNLGYRFIREELEQVDVSAQWPLGGRWTLLGRSLHSLREDRNVETYGGLEYNACCWAVRLLARRLYTETDGQVDSVLFQFELTGLGKFGALPESPLTQSLFSFAPPP